MDKKQAVVQVAVSGPFWQGLDYILPHDIAASSQLVGRRVLVPLGSRRVVGIILSLMNHSDLLPSQLKTIIQLLDQQPLIMPSLMNLYQWASDYYHFPIGSVIMNSLPKFIRRPLPIQFTPLYWYILSSGKQAFASLSAQAVKQKKLLQLLMEHPQGMSLDDLKKHHMTLSFCKSLVSKGWISYEARKDIPARSTPIIVNKEIGLNLNQQQQDAVQAITQSKGFTPFLLAGVTGSGKTEVYMQAMEPILQQGQKVLVLIPEISLTPQTVARFENRFALKVQVMHSRLSAGVRAAHWLETYAPGPLILIGTRSAVFAPLTNLGMIIIDEEHDLSFKQQATFRYHARDVALVRAKKLNIPLILGSATPALESFNNAWRKKYHLLTLGERATGASLPDIRIIDARGDRCEGGLSETLLAAIKSHLKSGQQVMIFINRRGYAPIVMCHNCGYMESCQQCDARLVLHKGSSRLKCHHCDRHYPRHSICPDCQQQELALVGVGTQRIAETLQQHFPSKTIIRIDKDSTTKKNSMQELLSSVSNLQADVVVGTQMLAKGHHFENLSLVAIVDIDAGLFGVDFRATEHLSQLLIQVAGRAGRGAIKGEVLLQTHHPEHPLLQALLQSGYQNYLQIILNERQQALLPPYSFLALVHVESQHSSHPLSFLETIKRNLQHNDLSTFDILGPAESVMTRKANQYRAQLLLRSTSRKNLQAILQGLPAVLTATAHKYKIRWSLDVDPVQL